ncbi:MAG: hypothetical protein ABL998_02815 [Planctomycetota bacterium]
MRIHPLAVALAAAVLLLWIVVKVRRLEGIEPLELAAPESTEPRSLAEIAPREALTPEAEARSVRRRETEAVAPKVSAVLQRASDCLAGLATMRPEDQRETLAGSRACLAGLALETLEPEQVAELFCREATDLWPQQVLLEELLLRRPPADVLDFVDRLQASICEEEDQNDRNSVLRLAEDVAPEWLAELRRSLTAEALFAGTSDGSVLFMSYFVERGDAEVIEWLSAAACGEIAATEAQALRAASSVLAHERDLGRRIDFAERLLRAVGTAPPEVGGPLLVFLAPGLERPEHRARTLRLLENALHDPAFAPIVAAQLLARESLTSDVDLQRLYDRARAVLGR